MSDFLFSNINIEKGLLTKILKKNYKNDEIMEFHGEWGSLAINNSDLKTQLIYSNNETILIGLGNPVSLDQLNLKIDSSYFNNNTDWSKLINGPFALLFIDKKSNQTYVLTDLMSFIPIYLNEDTSEGIYISSQVDLLAKLTKKNEERDDVSELDFILNGIVTFPYTCYKGIIQLQPGTEFNLKSNNIISEKQYWAPYECEDHQNLDKEAKILNTIVGKDLSNSQKYANKNAHFLSGGEDSRVIAGLLKEKNKDSFLFLDSYNLEGKIANKIAHIYNSNLTIKYRKPSYYIDTLKGCSRLIGMGIEHVHGHSYGFVEECNLADYDLVYGGLYSDAMLKGSRIKKTKLTTKFTFLPERKSDKYSIYLENQDNINTEYITKINNRRKKHFEFIKKYRNKTVVEWFELYPSTMTNSSANYHVNRRLFNSYEPFLSNDVVKFSARIPQSYKLNRRVFNLAFKDILRPSRRVRHGEGRFPYYPWYINGGIHFSVKMFRKLRSFVSKRNPGPWPIWDIVMSTTKWEEMIDESIEKAPKFSFFNYSVENMLKEKDFKFNQKLNLMEIIYLMEK